MKIIRDISGKLPIIIIIVVMVAGLGAGAFVFAKKGKTAHAGSKPEKKVVLTSVQMDEFMVTLADPGELRYLKVNMVLEIEAPHGKSKGKHGEGDGIPEEAKAKDTIISVLTSKRVSNLISENGKTKLKEELKEALNDTLHETEVHNIYFTSFAMQ